MKTSLDPRVVIVTRQSDIELLLARHGTREQVRFFLEARGLDIGALEERRRRHESALAEVRAAIPAAWRRANVMREDLERFLFGPEDVVVAVGQDGLVANLAKYVTEQVVIGVNPDPKAYEGVLVPHAPDTAGDAIIAAVEESVAIQERTMVEARQDDGQFLLALNEIFVGHRSHQSARYKIAFGAAQERQSSSGVVVSTGTGASGWARSISGALKKAPALPDCSDPRAVFFVREAWPSVSTGTSLTSGAIAAGEALTLVSEMNSDGVVFGDGIESDHLAFEWGRTVSIRVSDRRLRFLGR